MEVNSAMEKLGFLKKWHLLICVLVLFVLQPIPSWNKYAFVFVGYIPKHHCKIPDNSSIQAWIPKDEDGNYESCSIYVNSSVSNDSKATVPCTDGWDYTEADCGLTIVNEWDLVCDKAFYAGLTHMMYQVGEIIGFYKSNLADIFGRKPIALSFMLISSFIGVINSFADSYTSFLLGKFFLGLFSIAPGFYGVYLAEITSNKNRDFLVANSYLNWGVNCIILVVIAYFLKNWRYLRFFTNLYGLLMLPILYFFLPETVYWLHANNKIKEAEDILIKAAKLNNVQFTKPILIPPQNNDDSKEDKKYFEEKSFLEKLKKWSKTIFKKAFSSKSSLKTQYSIKELYRNKYLLRHMLFGVFLVFKILNTIGLTYMAPEITPHMYLSSFLNFVVEIPCGLMGWLLVKRYGVRRIMVFFMFLTTIATFLVPIFLVLTDKSVFQYTTIIFIVAAKLFGSIVWALSYSYSATLFPTNLRNQAVGICHVFSRIANMAVSFSPYVYILAPIGIYIIFGVCALLSALILLLLPETHGRVLPETIEDIEDLYKKGDAPRNEKHLQELEVLSGDSDEN